MKTSTWATAAALFAAGGASIYGLSGPNADAKSPTQKSKTAAKDTRVYDFTMKSLAGKNVPLSKYEGRVLLIVNTASKCGFTPQYAGLEKLHEQYAPKGLAILGFPANDFGGQEPGTDPEIGAFCEKNYGVKFDIFSKIRVKGDDKHPLYAFLTAQGERVGVPGEVKWNFEKFLMNRDGKIVARFRSNVKPESDEIRQAIEAELARGS